VALGLKALELPTDAEAGVDIAALAHALDQKSVTTCLFSSSFNNPLGCTMPDAKKPEFLRLLTRHGVPLIEDDIYFGAKRPKPFGALYPAAKTIYCSSFSKTIAPGYRIGWLMAGRHMRTVLQQKLASTLATSALTQAAPRRPSFLRRLRQPSAPHPGRLC
jgi:DNA-binding transcriptional MocR family regulator